MVYLTHLQSIMYQPILKAVTQDNITMTDHKKADSLIDFLRRQS
jgi:hypothetical protein